MKNLKTKRGYSLMEMLVYVALLSLLSLAVIEGVITITRVSSQFMITRDLNHSGRVAMEQMIREIRVANNVDSGASTFNDANGKLQLDSQISTVVEFFIDSSQLKQELDDVDMGYLTSKNVTVDELTFFHITNSETEAVRIVLVLSAQKGTEQKSITFYNTAVLRGSY